MIARYFSIFSFALLTSTILASDSSNPDSIPKAEEVAQEKSGDDIKTMIERRKSLSLEELRNDTLPMDPHERDQQLLTFYNEIIPLLLSWQIANQKSFDYLDDGYMIPEWLFTPFPYNPYREPGMDRRFLFPGTMVDWNSIIADFKKRKEVHKRIIEVCSSILRVNDEKGDIQLIDEKLTLDEIVKPYHKIITESSRDFTKDHFLLKSVLTRPEVYNKEAFDIQKIFQDQFEKMIKGSYGVERKPLSVEQIKNIHHFMAYHQKQLDKIDDFMRLFDSTSQGDEKNIYPILDPEIFFKKLPGLLKRLKEKQPIDGYEEIKEFYDLLRPFFLNSPNLVSEVIHSKFLQGNKVSDLEIIVYDELHNYSRHMEYSPLSAQSHYSEKNKRGSFHSKVQFPSHSTAVTGIIGANQDLEQFQGIAPGAKILPIENITPGTLELIRKSKARVINISRGNAFPKSCQKLFEEKKSYVPLNASDADKKSKSGEPPKQLSEYDECSLLWEFVQLVQDKDMIIVQSAGNEGLQLEEIDWITGIPDKNLTNSARGLQDERNIQGNFNGEKIDQSYISRQIPQLKDRLIMVGAVLPDGKNITSYSSLPGAFPKNFIYAPGDVTAIYTSTVPGTNSNRYSELGTFSGTSAAAPLVSGVIAQLSRLFPDLPMKIIKQCVLNSADPFWEGTNRQFPQLKGICGEKKEGITGCSTPYGGRIFGKGLLNAEAAYHLCIDENERYRKNKTSVSGLEDQVRSIIQEEENPFYKIMERPSSGETNLIEEVKVYYSKSPQLPVNDEKIGLVPPLRVAITLENKWKGLVDILLESKPKLTDQEANDLLDIIMDNYDFYEKVLPISLFDYLILEKKVPVEKYKDNSNFLKLLPKAVREKHYELPKMILNMGVSPNIRNFGSKPTLVERVMSVMSDQKDSDFARFLLEKKNTINNISETNTHKNPLCIAIRQKNAELLELLLSYNKIPPSLKCIEDDPVRFIPWIEYVENYKDPAIEGVLAKHKGEGRQ